MIDTADMREKYYARFQAGIPYARDIYRLTDEVDRLRGVICEFARQHSWGANGWKKSSTIAPLFDIASQVEANAEAHAGAVATSVDPVVGASEGGKA